MKRTSFEKANCSIARALETVGEWWSLLVLREAFLGSRRFDEFQANLGIARNVLTTRLAALVEHGVLERRPYQERPRRYEYRLTEKGVDLYPVLAGLMAWGDRWACDKSGPPVVLVDVHTGKPVRPVLVDGTTKKPIDPRSLRPVPGPGAKPALRKRFARREEMLRARAERGSSVTDGR